MKPLQAPVFRSTDFKMNSVTLGDPVHLYEVERAINSSDINRLCNLFENYLPPQLFRMERYQTDTVIRIQLMGIIPQEKYGTIWKKTSIRILRTICEYCLKNQHNFKIGMNENQLGFDEPINFTALHIVATRGDVYSCIILLNYGVDFYAKNIFGDSPLQQALFLFLQKLKNLQRGTYFPDPRQPSNCLDLLEILTILCQWELLLPKKTIKLLRKILLLLSKCVYKTDSLMDYEERSIRKKECDFIDILTEKIAMRRYRKTPSLKQFCCVVIKANICEMYKPDGIKMLPLPNTLIEYLLFTSSVLYKPEL